MSNSFKDNKARDARKLAKELISKFNSDDHADINQTQQEQKSLQTDGIRYGNNRKMMAEKKVQARRVERKKLNKINMD